MSRNNKANKAIERNSIISSFQVAVGGFFSFIFGMTAISCIINLGGTVELNAAIVIFILFALFLYMLICGIRRKRLAGRYNSYINLLDQGQAHSIDQLAGILNAKPHVVKSNLERMINKKFLGFAYIDNETNSIVNTRGYWGHPQYSNMKPEEVQPKTTQVHTSTSQRTTFNGKVVSQDDPAVKEILENVQDIVNKAMSNQTDFGNEFEKVGNFFESMSSTAPQPQTQEKQQKVVKCEGCGAKNTIVTGEAAICKYCGNGLES